MESTKLFRVFWVTQPPLWEKGTINTTLARMKVQKLGDSWRKRTNGVCPSQRFQPLEFFVVKRSFVSFSDDSQHRSGESPMALNQSDDKRDNISRHNVQWSFSPIVTNYRRWSFVSLISSRAFCLTRIASLFPRIRKRERNGGSLEFFLLLAARYRETTATQWIATAPLYFKLEIYRGRKSLPA